MRAPKGMTFNVREVLCRPITYDIYQQLPKVAKKYYPDKKKLNYDEIMKVYAIAWEKAYAKNLEEWDEDN